MINQNFKTAIVNPPLETRLMITRRGMQRKRPAYPSRRQSGPSHYARHKETGLNVHTTVHPASKTKGTITSVFNWPATCAVYAAITRKVKAKSNCEMVSLRAS